MTSQWACFGIWGPRARDVLEPLTPQSLTNGDFPYMTLRETTVAGAPVRALRVTYVGELGWELYTPSEYGLGLWQALWEAGAPQGMVAGGYRAIDSLRLEKGYRVWGADVTPDTTPYEGGVGFAVKPEKETGFIGRAALAARGERSRLCCLTLDDPRSVALGNEPVRVDGEVAGRVTSGGYGYSVERSIAYAHLPPIAGRRGRRRGRDLRALGRRPGGERAAVRPGRRAGARLAARATRHQAGQDVLGALDVLAHEPHRAAGVALAQQADQAPVLVVRARQHFVRMRDAGDQVAHLPLDLRHRGYEPRRV